MKPKHVGIKILNEEKEERHIHCLLHVGSCEVECVSQDVTVALPLPPTSVAKWTVEAKIYKYKYIKSYINRCINKCLIFNRSTHVLSTDEGASRSP